MKKLHNSSEQALMLRQAQQLQQYANGALSNFAGSGFDGYEGDNHYDGDEGYDGDDYDGLDGLENYGGIDKMFRDEIDKSTQFTINLVNANAAVRTALLVPGYNWSQGGASNPAGAIATGAFNDTTGAAGLTGSGSPKTIEEFLSYIKQVPTFALGIQIRSTTALQMQQMMTLQPLSPFKALQQEIVNLSSYTDEYVQQQTVVTIKRRFDLNNQMQISLPIAGSATTSITFFVGPMANPVKAANDKVRRAIRNTKTTGIARNMKRRNFNNSAQ